MENIRFQPGAFTPVMEVTVAANPVPREVQTNYNGLHQMERATASVARNVYPNRMGLNDPAFFAEMQAEEPVAMHYLAARNLAQQLREIHGIETRFTSALVNSSPTLTTPLIRAYGYYGHFSVDGTTYSTSSPRERLVYHLMHMAHYATQDRVHAPSLANSPAVMANYDNDLFTITDSGDLCFTTSNDLLEHKLVLIRAISTSVNLANETYLPLIKEVTELASIASLNQFKRELQQVHNMTAAEIAAAIPAARVLPPAPGPAAPDPRTPIVTLVNALFGTTLAVHQVVANTVIPHRLVNAAINRATQLLQRRSMYYEGVFPLGKLPRYEGGTSVQAAYCSDQNLVSSLPLSMDEACFAYLFDTGYAATSRFRSLVNFDREERRQLFVFSLLSPR